MLHSQVQIRAQEELDKIVGRQRLPAFSDRVDLPYINAIYKEVLRWFPIVPLSTPHSVITDDDYNGMWIPKGSIIVPNQWYETQNL